MYRHKRFCILVLIALGLLPRFVSAQDTSIPLDVYLFIDISQSSISEYADFYNDYRNQINNIINSLNYNDRLRVYIFSNEVKVIKSTIGGSSVFINLDDEAKKSAQIRVSNVVKRLFELIEIRRKKLPLTIKSEEDEELNNMNYKDTNIYVLIDFCAKLLRDNYSDNELERIQRKRLMVVMSDGLHEPGNDINDSSACGQSSRLDIRECNKLIVNKVKDHILQHSFERHNRTIKFSTSFILFRQRHHTRPHNLSFAESFSVWEGIIDCIDLERNNYPVPFNARIVLLDNQGDQYGRSNINIWYKILHALKKKEYVEATISDGNKSILHCSTPEKCEIKIVVEYKNNYEIMLNYYVSIQDFEVEEDPSCNQDLTRCTYRATAKGRNFNPEILISAYPNNNGGLTNNHYINDVELYVKQNRNFLTIDPTPPFEIRPNQNIIEITQDNINKDKLISVAMLDYNISETKGIIASLNCENEAQQSNSFIELEAENTTNDVKKGRRKSEWLMRMKGAGTAKIQYHLKIGNKLPKSKKHQFICEFKPEMMVKISQNNGWYNTYSLGAKPNQFLLNIFFPSVEERYCGIAQWIINLIIILIIIYLAYNYYREKQDIKERRFWIALITCILLYFINIAIRQQSLNEYSQIIYNDNKKIYFAISCFIAALLLNFFAFQKRWLKNVFEIMWFTKTLFGLILFLLCLLCVNYSMVFAFFKKFN